MGKTHWPCTLPGAVLSQEAVTWYVDKAAYDDVH